MLEGFSLELDDYCSHCGDFEANVEKEDVTVLYERAHSYVVTIKCKNAYKCARISENLKKRST